MHARMILVLALAAHRVDAFHAVPCASAPDVRAARTRSPLLMAKKDWSKRKTLAEEAGGSSDKGFDRVGLIGTIPVDFKQGDGVKTTMALTGQPLSQVAIQAGQIIKYQCRKGECGTCEVTVGGEKVRVCQAYVPPLEEGHRYTVEVPLGKVKTKKQSTFFSIRSFLDGFRNNFMGIIGFVRYGAKEKDNFNHRMSSEQQLKEVVAAKKAAKLKSQQQGQQ